MFIAQQDKYRNELLTPQQEIEKYANKTNIISANRTQFHYCYLGSWFPLHFLAFKDPHPLPLEFPIPSVHVCVCGWVGGERGGDLETFWNNTIQWGC